MSGGREGAGGEDGGGEALAVIAAAEGVEVATGEHERVEGAGGVTAGGVGGAEVAGVGLPDPAVGVLVRSGLLGGLQPDIGGGAPLLAGVRELAAQTAEDDLDIESVIGPATDIAISILATGQ